MSNQQSTARCLLHWRRIWGLILPVSLAAAALFAFISISKSVAQGPNPVHFDNCVTNTGGNATMFVPGGAPKIHTVGYFTPVAGDEFAIFRPVGGTCATLAQSLCAGVIVWQGQGVDDAFPVWGDNTATGGVVDGMLGGERMCWRVWDASENKVYTATVEYDDSFLYDSSGLFAVDGFYRILRLDPNRPRASVLPGWQQPGLGADGGTFRRRLGLDRRCSGPVPEAAQAIQYIGRQKDLQIKGA